MTKRESGRRVEFEDMGETNKMSTLNEGDDLEEQDAFTEKKKRKTKAAFLNSLNITEKEMNHKIIKNMNKRINYLRNPRFKETKAPIGTNMDAGGDLNDEKNAFVVDPGEVEFRDYQVNELYEIPLKITNRSSISKRLKYIPPKEEYFSVRNVKYPSSESGLIAPGMSLVLYIQFAAPSFADFDDFLTVITEENSFKVPITARRQPPIITLANPMEAPPCWVGDQCDVVLKCTNSGGDGGFKFFCERDEDDEKQEGGEYIKIGAFNIFRSEFFLYGGQSIDIYLNFHPEVGGINEERMILACDNQTHTTYTLRAKACMLDLEVLSIDDRKLNFKKNPLRTIFFPTTEPNSERSRNITLKNNSGMVVRFHWSLYKTKNPDKISIAEEEVHYRIEPLQGKFQIDEEVTFKILFQPLHAESYFEFADLIIEDIPIQSVRDPPPTLKNLLKTGIPGPTYLGSNTRFPSIPYLKFNLQGHGDLCKLSLNPSILEYKNDLLLFKNHKNSLQLKNETESALKFKITFEGKTSGHFDINLKSPCLTTDDYKTYNGVLDTREETIDVHIHSFQIGKQMGYFKLNVEDGVCLSFQINAFFVGPTVKLIEKNVNFGLMKINSSNEFRLNVENLSEIEAELILKNCKNKRLTFDDFKEGSSSKDEENMSSLIPKDLKSKRLCQSSSVASIPGRGANITIAPMHKKLAPFEKTSFLVSISTANPETIQEYLQLMLKNGKSRFISLSGEIQKPHVFLNLQKMDLGRTFAGLKYRINRKHQYALFLHNFGNHPAHFQWEEKVIGDYMKGIFEPARGIIPPHSNLFIEFNLTLFKGGKITDLFVCDVTDVDDPLGFQIETDVFGLSVSYEIMDQARTFPTKPLSKNATQSELQSLLPGSLYDGKEREKFSTNVLKEITTQGETELKELNFGDSTINKSNSRKFIIKNNSGISTGFTLTSLNFEPLVHKGEPSQTDLHKEGTISSRPDSSETKTYTDKVSSFRSRMTDRSKGIKFSESVRMKGTRKKKKEKGVGRMILSDAHEETNKFTSATGETFTQTRRMDKEMQFYLANNKGLAVVCTPHEGQLKPHSELVITVTVYNNICGKYDDVIISNVRGLDPFRIPIAMSIKGSPVIIPPNQVGLHYQYEPPCLVIPPIVRNSPKVKKVFKILNTGIRDVHIDWKLYDLKDVGKGTADLFNISIAKAEGNAREPYKLEFEAIEPTIEAEDSCFSIFPKTSIVKAKQTYQYTVTLNTDTKCGEFNTVVLAHPYLSEKPHDSDEDDEIELDPERRLHKQKEEEQTSNLGVTCVSLKATTIEPVLTIDKKKRIDGTYSMKYEAWSVKENSPSLIKKMAFTNETSADLIFNISVNGPFELISTKTNSPAHPLVKSASTSKIGGKKNQIVTMFNLHPLKIVELELKFIAPAPDDYDNWPNAMKNLKHGSLEIFYSNGITQSLYLEAELYRPKIKFISEHAKRDQKAQLEIDFGTVFIDGEQLKRVKAFISNESHVTAKWVLNYKKFPVKRVIGLKTLTPLERENIMKKDDPDVFEFSGASGTLSGPSFPLKASGTGPSLPHIDQQEYLKFLPQRIFINFRPTEDKFYKSMFKFEAENGISCDVILKGKGEYKEEP